MDQSNSASLIGFLATFYLIFGVIMIAMFVFMVWLYWRIFTKAGYNGALALLNLVPAGSLVCAIILAFGRWPVEDELAAARGLSPMVPPPPPGSAMMPTV